MEREREQKINELLELINIPEIEAAVFHHLNLIKREVEEEINLYRNLKSGFKLTVYGDLYIYTGQKREGFPVYYFELRRKARNHWVLADINPQPPDNVDIDEIVPQEIIDQLGAENIEPDRIKYLQNEVETTSGYKSYALRFAKYSDSLVLGNIRQIKTWRKQGRKKKAIQPSEDQSGHQSDSDSRIVKSASDFRDHDDLETIETLFYYIQKYPEVKKQMCEDFYTRIKPYIDRKMNSKAISS